MRRIITTAAAAALAIGLGACGTKHVTVTIKGPNGSTITTTSAADCRTSKAARAALDRYNAGVDAWNALPQADRNAVEASGGFEPQWAAQHGYPTAAPPVNQTATVGCPG
jgi:hypothetical protein